MINDLAKLQQLPTLPPEQYYIYCIENSDKYIKIGITHNPYQRLTSLSGSNGGGSVITRYVISPATYLYSMETVCHNHFNRWRIKGTEWFKGITLEEAAKYVKLLFSSKEYKTCNELRKRIAEEVKNKENDKKET